MTYPEETTLFVPGTPVPQGSKSISRSGRMFEANKNLKPWRDKITAEAARYAPFGDVPVEVWLAFRFEAPQRPKFKAPAVKPDLDKLIRAVNDALTASGIIHDDARITRLTANKRYANKPGVVITIRRTT